MSALTHSQERMVQIRSKYCCSSKFEKKCCPKQTYNTNKQSVLKIEQLSAQESEVSAYNSDGISVLENPHNVFAPAVYFK